MRRVLVTGANGHLGRRLIHTLPEDWAVAALVRRERAREILLRHVGEREHFDVTVADPGDAEALAELGADCDAAVHLVGTIRETRSSRYEDAHERPARALAAAARRCQWRQIVTVSILGADERSPSRCLRSRAAAEAALLDSSVPASVVRVPMVLGEGDRASAALARRAAGPRAFLFRAASLEQPIYAGDVVAAMVNALAFDTPRDAVFDLAGPESLPRRALVQRAAAAAGRTVRVYSLPLRLGLGFAWLLERTRAAPPVTREMLRVLDHDDAIDPHPAAAALGLALTPLDEMLRLTVAARVAAAQAAGR